MNGAVTEGVRISPHVVDAALPALRFEDDNRGLKDDLLRRNPGDHDSGAGNVLHAGEGCRASAQLVDD
jgi:hypothetical protein